MTLLKIANLGHPILRTPARPVSPDEIQSKTFQKFIDSMIETMRYSDGIGLAAPQVHSPQALIVYVEWQDNDRDLQSGTPPKIGVLINPRFKPTNDAIVEDWEGCLSLKDLRGVVPRHRDIWVTGLDRAGAEVETRVSGMTARIIQHECDHLEGIVFIDRMEKMESLGFLYEITKFWKKDR